MDIRDIFQNLGPGSILERTQKRFLLKRELSSEEAFCQVKEIIIGQDNETLTIETIGLHTLHCSHVVGAVGPQEYLGDCVKCGNSICFRCDIKCKRCLSLICKDCTRHWEDKTYCFKCRVIVVGTKSLVSFFKGIYEFCSKEF